METLLQRIAGYRKLSRDRFMDVAMSSKTTVLCHGAIARFAANQGSQHPVALPSAMLPPVF